MRKKRKGRRWSLPSILSVCCCPCSFLYTTLNLVREKVKYLQSQAKSREKENATEVFFFMLYLHVPLGTPCCLWRFVQYSSKILAGESQMERLRVPGGPPAYHTLDTELSFTRDTPNVQPRENILSQTNQPPSTFFSWPLPGHCLVPSYLKTVPILEALDILGSQGLP